MRREITSFPLTWSVVQLDKKAGRQVGEELPAQVPGDIFSDLFRAGRIPDPYLNLNSDTVQWVNDYDWRYRGHAELHPEDKPRRTWLEFLGLDYRYNIAFNDHPLFSGEGMFSRRQFEVSPWLREKNVIEVTFSGLPDRWLEKRFPPLIVNTEPVRRRYLKTQMSFGWDFAPRLKGCGIWDEVRLFSTGPVMIDDLWVQARLNGEVDLALTLESATELTASLHLTITGESFSGFEKKEAVSLKLKTGKNHLRHSWRVEAPKFWWPWDQGQPDLYRLELAVEVDDEISDAVSERFGFREVSWEQNPAALKKALPWVLRINGRRVFLRGANLVPMEAMAGRFSGEKCEKLLALAREANLNCLRLWGGGNRERRIVYETCDRLGLLLWQEFPLACLNFGAPRSQKFLGLLKQECAEIVRSLRNRPCVFMWCGGNEFNVHLSRPALKIMAEVCQELDPSRRFVPASPFRGDAHNWLVWHMKGNLEDYFREPAQLVSEFGLQAAPAVESLREFLSPDLLWPISPGWRHHHLGQAKMEKYVKHFGGPAQSLESFVQASQEAQAHFLQRGIEFWRRQKYRKSGALVWQWNDPWPAISWSVVDYFGRKKLSFRALQLACQPLLVGADFPQKSYRPGDRLQAKIFLVNDLPRDFSDLELEARIGEGLVKTMRVSVKADEVAEVGTLDLTLPLNQEPRLKLSAREHETLVSENDYSLLYHDPEPASWLKRRLFKRLWQFLSE